jgi:hypothetical protein
MPGIADDIFAGPVAPSAPNSMRFALPDGITPAVSVNGGNYGPLGAAPVDFVAETLALARALMPTLGFNRQAGSDLAPLWEVALTGGANAPVVDITKVGTGGVLSFSGAGTSGIALNPVTPGAATYNPILGAFACRCAGWMVRARVLINATTFTAATTVVLCSLDGSGVGGGGATHKIQIVSNPTLSAQQTYVRLQSAAAGPVDYSTGADGMLAGPGSLLPFNNWTTVTLFFDGIKLRWMFGDQFNPLNFLDATVLSVPASGGASIGQLDDMPDDATSVTMSSSDLTIGANLKVDAIAIAYCVNVENA